VRRSVTECRGVHLLLYGIGRGWRGYRSDGSPLPFGHRGSGERSAIVAVVSVVIVPVVVVVCAPRSTVVSSGRRGGAFVVVAAAAAAVDFLFDAAVAVFGIVAVAIFVAAVEVGGNTL